MDEEELREEVEQSIDMNSLQFWLQELATICYEKASHIESEWQDKALARDWNTAGDAIINLASKPVIDKLS